jgi:hypothetical protein
VRGRGDHRTLDLFDEALRPSLLPGSLAGLKTQIAHLMSAAVRDCGMDRYEIAAKMGALLGEDVPKAMLDAYTAESREDQNAPAHRLFAFILATDSFVALDQLMRRLGCRLLVGDEAKLATIAKLELQRAHLDQRLRELKRGHKGARRA